MSVGSRGKAPVNAHLLIYQLYGLERDVERVCCECRFTWQGAGECTPADKSVVWTGERCRERESVVSVGSRGKAPVNAHLLINQLYGLERDVERERECVL